MQTTAQPAFSSERMAFRPFEPADAPRIVYLAGDWEVARMCARVPHPYPRLAAEGWISIQTAARAKGEEFPFAVTLPIDGLIGSCGVVRSKEHSDVFEIGYWFGRPYWGKGYATEAGRALMDWARRELGARTFTAGHFADNPASGAVLRKLGFIYTHQIPFFGLARGGVSPSDRYIWPNGEETGMEQAHASH
ncbi:MAG: GNAT family N-acetyltransferase [Hyphomonadaceae bacterium]